MDQDEIKSHRGLEFLTLSTLWPGLILTVAGGALWWLPLENTLLPALAFITTGLVLQAASIGASYVLATMKSMRTGTTGGKSYDRLRNWQNLKMSSLLLNGLAVGSALVFALSFVLRSGFVNLTLDPAIIDRGALVLIVAVSAAHALAHHYSLRFEIEKDRTGTRLVLTMLGGLIALLGAGLAGLAVFRGQALQDSLGIGSDGVPMLVLGGQVFAAYALFSSRNLPTFAILYSEQRSAYGGLGASDKGQKAFLPALIAFALLVVVFLLFVVFGVGVVDIVSNVAKSPLVLGAFLFLVVVLIISVGSAVNLARGAEEKTPLWKPPRNPREKLQQTILFGSMGIAFLFLLFAGLVWSGDGVLGIPSKAWIHFFCLGIMVGVGPYGFYMTSESKRIRMLEERFPDFLRDVASSHKGGLTLSESIRVASRGEYGPLTPEIRKMADQLSWNVGFSESLVRFGDRVQTPLVERAVSLILEANRSGGSTTDVLLAAARDAREIKNMENERRLSMGLYTVVIYITFFVFLAVASVLYAQFVPEIVKSSEAAQALGGGGPSGIGGETLRLEDFQLFYFLAAVMQGLGDGIVAGMMGAGKAVMGLRHAFIMVLISYLTFTLFLV